MMLELLLAAILAIGSLLSVGHNGIGKGHYDHGQGKGLRHAKHGDICSCDCNCELPCVPPCDGGY